jgi:hypothetical protein
MTDEGKSAGSKEADGKSSEKVGFDSSKYVNMEVVARCLAELKGARTAAPRTKVNLPLEDINTIINARFVCKPTHVGRNSCSHHHMW